MKRTITQIEAELGATSSEAACLVATICMAFIAIAPNMSGSIEAMFLAAANHSSAVTYQSGSNTNSHGPTAQQAAAPGNQNQSSAPGFSELGGGGSAATGSSSSASTPKGTVNGDASELNNHDGPNDDTGDDPGPDTILP